MTEVDMKKMLSSFAKISKQWGLGESVGNVWGFLIFKSVPITQKEIEKGINCSRGLVSRSLKKLDALDMLSITKKGKVFYYSTNASLIKGFNKIVNNFIETDIKSISSYLSKNLDEITDPTVKKNVRRMIKEYKKLNLGVRIFSKTMDRVVLLNVETIGEIAKKHSIKL